MDKYFESKRVIIATLATIGAIGAIGYLVYNSKSKPGDASNATDGPSTASRSAVKRKKNKKKAAAKKSGNTSHGFETTRDSPDAPEYPVIDDWSKVLALNDSERQEIGEEFKLAGNAAFAAKKFDKALELYTDAIKAYDKNPVFYSNRAAVWGSLKDYDRVIADTTIALKLRPDYVKCYSRRGLAYEHIKNYREAIMDYTASCIMQNFEDSNVGNSVDRVLKIVAEELVAEHQQELQQEFPSANFIRTYLHSYHRREIPEHIVQTSADDENSGEFQLKVAFDAIDKENQESYKQAFESLKAAIAGGFNKGSEQQNKEAEALAYEYLGTFEFLCNDSENALKSLNHSIAVHPTVPAFLKRSAVHIESQRLQDADADFEKARALDPNNADFFYQLAQVAFLQSDWKNAVENYRRSIVADNDFILAHIQLAVTEYRMGEIEESKKRFEGLLKKYPEEPYVFNYYGEILLDLKDVDTAISMFDIAVKLEKTKSVAAINVLPLVNKGLALIQRAETPAQFEVATTVCTQAATLDPMSDIAIGTLAQLALQQGRTTEAIELFERNARLARTQTEQVQAYTFAEAARTQYRIALERPAVREHLEILSRSRR